MTSMRSPQKSRRAFALVITVVLLALLILVLVSTATLTRIETSIGFNSRRHSQAQQNALFALNRAIGELQRHAGPDQRVTARSDILGTTPSTDGRSFWTGVWDASGTGGPLTWLVNGNEDRADGDFAVDPTADVRTGERLVGPKSVSDPKHEVRVHPSVLTSDNVPGLPAGTPVGRYAWWVGDEGVKASIALVNPLELVDFAGSNTDYSDPVNQRRLGRLAQREVGRIHEHIPEVRTDYFFTTETLTASQQGDLGRVLGRNQLPMVSGALGLPVFRQRFHDVTVTSLGVMANTKEAGLKYDLTNPSSASSGLLEYLSPGTRPVETVDGNGFIPVYELRPLIGGASGVNSPFLSISPVVLKAGISVKVTLPGSGGGSPKAQWEAYLVFWNPYNARLKILPDGVAIRLETPPTLLIGGREVDWNSMLGDVDGLQRIKVPADLFPNERLEPGVTVVVPIPLSAETLLREPDGSPLNLAGSPYSVSMKAASLSSGPVPTRINLDDAAGALLAAYELNLFPDTSLTPQPADGVFYVDLGFGFNVASNDWWNWVGFTDPRGPSVFRGDDDESRIAVAPPSPPTVFPGFWTANSHPVFELPWGENISLGALQHLGFTASASAVSRPFRLGNVDSLGVNSWADRFYFSSIPLVGSGGGGQVWDSRANPLPNGSLAPYNPVGSEALTIDELISLGANADDRLPASRLLIRGAFNLNSTSVLAWTEVLDGANSPNWRGENEPDLTRIFCRFPHSAEVFDDPNPSFRPIELSDIWTQGIRYLTPLQRDGLAQKIVERLYSRGAPFGSLEEFLDSGLLDNAIADFDAANPTNDLRINQQYSYGGVHPQIPRFAAAYLGQSELFNNWAPFLQARSDTFVIRTYGESDNPVTGAVEARAWCEAVVQRTPDYVNPDETAAWEIPASGSTNEKFGRRFQVIQFRWLSPADI